MKIKRLLAGLLTAACLCCILSVQAETVRGDLTARFAGKPTMELDGETLTLRGRVTTALLVGLIPREEGQEAYLIALVAEDDNRKLVSPIWLEGGVAAAAFEAAENAETGCRAAIEAMQGVMPGVEIDYFACLNLQGISEGEEMDEQRLRERVSALRAEIETASSAEIQALYKQMEPYIAKDMKSGAMMKFLDKADRYERRESVHLDERDEAATSRLMADVFYEPAQ